MENQSGSNMSSENTDIAYENESITPLLDTIPIYEHERGNPPKDFKLEIWNNPNNESYGKGRKSSWQNLQHYQI
jgi:hypothetical protein